MRTQTAPTRPRPAGFLRTGLWIALAYGCLPALPTMAQTVQGRVADGTGAPIAGATVVAADSATGEVRRATTDPEGVFVFRFDGDTIVIAVAAQAVGYAPAVSPRLRLEPEGVESLLVTLEPLVAAPAEATLRVQGRVVDERGQAVREAAVSLALDDSSRVLSELTDPNGRFTFDLNRDDAVALVTVSALGFSTPPPTRILVPAGGAFLDIELPVDPVQIEGLDVTVRPYESRYDVMGMTDRAAQASGRGRFLFEEDLEPYVGMASGNTANLLRRVPGIWVSGTEPSFASAGCAPSVWVDGMQVSGLGIPRTFAEVAPPAEDIGGIEVYRPFSMPAQFGGFGAQCGAIVIWTKGS